MVDFYPKIEPFNQFMLTVSEEHQLYVEECGNPDGQPVVFLHGGPGGGCSANDRRFFDPLAYRIILFDQRGCGRSKPLGSLVDNTTEHLMDDIEKIRERLAIAQWHVFGGSWGSTLALVYAQKHTDRVMSLVLRGIFLARDQDTRWTFAGGGASRIFPDYWQDYVSAIDRVSSDILQDAYQILISDDKQAAKKLARAWATWEIKCCTLSTDEEFLLKLVDDDACWTLARHECHFMVNNCFLQPNQILNDCHKIQHIKTTIVHGRYDVVCPVDNAWLLSEQLPNAKLVISDASGHASIEPNTKHHLIEATNMMLSI